MSRMYPVLQRIKVAGHIPFGGKDPNAKYGKHAGDDSANPVGTEVYAPTSGHVTPYKWSSAHGHIVEIFDGKNYPHSFHLSKRLVADGQYVTKGQLVGLTGNTGLSTGPHIHFGVSKKSVPNTTSFNDFIDPMEWLKQGEDMATKEQLIVLYEMTFPNQPVNMDWVSINTGKDMSDVLTQLKDDPSRQGYITKLVNQSAAYESQTQFVPLGKEVFIRKG